MKNENTKLKIVHLMDPSLCLNCRFAKIAEVEMEDGGSRKMLHCLRLDCDNWQMEETDDVPKSVVDRD